MSSDLRIMSRAKTKLLKVTDKAIFAASGFDGDLTQMQKTLQARAIRYQHRHGREMGVSALAQMVSTILYYRRFFPLYCFCLVAGVDYDGTGAVYSFDAIGSKERTTYHAAGTGAALIKPVLDNQLQAPSPLLHPPRGGGNALEKEGAIDVLKDCFAGAGERDIFTGDSVELLVVDPSGVRSECLPLKGD